LPTQILYAFLICPVHATHSVHPTITGFDQANNTP
jgi:hypothetical protein